MSTKVFISSKITVQVCENCEISKKNLCFCNLLISIIPNIVVDLFLMKNM
jgi:DTW domain-containing protein YfiP